MRPVSLLVSNVKSPGEERVTDSNSQADVVIVGAGLAGSIAALVFARQGKHVAIIDQHAVYPREFRCEKLSPAQMALMRELGVLDCLTDVTHEFDRILVVRAGCKASIQRQEERGLTYAAMVNKFREVWPEGVKFYEGRVAGITTNPARQRVILADGRVMSARLVILATGPGDKFPADLGFKRKIIRRTHSFCIGFGVEPAKATAFPFESMTYFGAHSGDRIGYATFFPMSEGMRVNLFSYHGKQEDWIAAFRQDPIGKLSEALPGIARFLGDFNLAAPVEIRPIDLYKTENYRRDGVVLIGDAFQSSCPATGAGVTRLLTDIRQLCLVHAPLWFASPGMEAGKLASFYEDRLKQTCDRLSMRAAERGRHLAIDKSLRWRFERLLLRYLGRFAIARKLASIWRKAPGIMS